MDYETAGVSQVLWVVWCGVVWCGVVWCGVVWCGVGAEELRRYMVYLVEKSGQC